MDHRVTALVLSGLLTSCAGKAPAPATVGNAGGAGAVPVAAGAHACQFVVDGTPYGPHRCDVSDGALDKVSGMETFNGVLTATGAGLTLEGTMLCGPMATACGQAFSVALTKEGPTWRGPVVASGGQGDWFLAGSTFELTDDAGYGGAMYGGESYGAGE